MRKFANLLDVLPGVLRNYSFPIFYADGAAAASLSSSAAAINNNNSTESQRRIVPPILGQSSNTGIQNNSAARLAAAFRKARKLPPLNKMVAEEFEGDNLSNYIANFCRWAAANTPVPHRFDEDLGAPDSNKCLGSDTKIQYIGKHLKDLRLNIVPKHPDFDGLKDVDRDHPTWWTDLRTRYADEADRFKAKNPGDEVFGHPDVIPLYGDLGHRRGGKDMVGPRGPG